MTATLATDLAATAEHAIHRFREAGDDVSACTDILVKLQQERAQRKTDALIRLCQQDHPVSGKKYSPSQAEDVLQLDPEYGLYKGEVASAEARLREAVDAREATLLIAKLRLTHFKREAGVS